jgi:hypothetical protein
MARLIRVPFLASVLVVSNGREIDDLIGHPGLARIAVRKGGLLNRLLVAALERQTRHRGDVLPAFRSRQDFARVAARQQLREHLDAFSDAARWPRAPVVQMARYVLTGDERREAEAALAFAVAWPFLTLGASVPQDDAYKPIGRHLWRLHRRMVRARGPLSPAALIMRLVGADRRARASILRHVSDQPYGLHAVEVTLANAREILEQMRRVAASLPSGAELTTGHLTWAVIRTAPEVVVRQCGGEGLSLPQVGRRLPPHTLVLLRMRGGLALDAASGYEFASGHWSACPARHFVMGLFAAVAAATVELQAAGVGR